MAHQALITDLAKADLQEITEYIAQDNPAADRHFSFSLIQERTSAGLKAARARGRVGGRPKTMDKKKLSIAESLYKDGKTNVSEICKTLGISRATFYRNISPLAV
ncbi:MAG: helix-turn-helix domain-containing protein [Verrucomicrobiota bacterium]